MSNNASTSPDDMLLVGHISVPFGIRGQLKLATVTSYPEHLRRVTTVFVGEELRAYKLQHAFVHKTAVVVITLEGVSSRDDAETFRGQEVFIREGDALPLQADEYYLHDLPGLRVRTTEGTEIGVVKEVVETGANDVLVVSRSEGGEALVPMIKDVVKQFDVGGGTITIEPLPGLLE